MSPAHSSMKVLIYFSSFLKFYSGVAEFFFDGSSLYLVPSSWLAFYDNMFEKPIPRLDRGLSLLPDVPTLPAQEGVGLYELGGGLIWNYGEMYSGAFEVVLGTLGDVAFCS